MNKMCVELLLIVVASNYRSNGPDGELVSMDLVEWRAMPHTFSISVDFILENNGNRMRNVMFTLRASISFSSLISINKCFVIPFKSVDTNRLWNDAKMHVPHLQHTNSHQSISIGQFPLCSVKRVYCLVSFWFGFLIESDDLRLSGRKWESCVDLWLYLISIFGFCLVFNVHIVHRFHWLDWKLY